MAREIKFRAFHQTWDMRYFTKPEDFKWFFGGTDGPETTLTECELMQYTGLKDKNGKEIYEGDIIKTVNGRVFEVIYNVPWAAFLLTNKYKQCDCERLGNYATEFLFEIIGNIYENPELLKEATNG